MSIRSNGTGDVIGVTVTGANSIGQQVGTGAFTVVVGFRFVTLAGGGTFNDVFVLRDSTDVNQFLYMYRDADQSTLTLNISPDPGSWTAVPAYTPTQGNWYWGVISRDGSSNLRVRIFDDTTSNNTPVDEETDAGYNVDIGDIYGGGEELDRIQLGEFTSGDWIDAEFRGLSVITGAELTNAQVRSWVNDVTQTTPPAGTLWGSWNLSNIDADSEGINDQSGNARHLTNSGFVNGSTDPAQDAGSENMLADASWGVQAEGPVSPLVSIVASDLLFGSTLGGIASVNFPTNADLPTNVFALDGPITAFGGGAIAISGEIAWGVLAEDGETLFIYVGGFSDLLESFTIDATEQNLNALNLEGEAGWSAVVNNTVTNLTQLHEAEIAWGAEIPSANIGFFLDAEFAWGATLSGPPSNVAIISADKNIVVRGGTKYVLSPMRTIVRDY